MITHDTTPTIWLRKKINCLQNQLTAEQITSDQYHLMVAAARLDCMALSELDTGTRLVLPTPIGKIPVTFDSFKTDKDATLYIAYRILEVGGTYLCAYDKDEVEIVNK